MSIVMNYEAMFGAESDLITDTIFPEILPVTIRRSIITDACVKAQKRKQWLLIFVVGTKPCFYKFWGSIKAAEENDLPYIIVNAGQHYDSLLTHGIAEFSYADKMAVNLSIRGDLAQKAGEIIFKMSWLSRHLKKTYPKITTVPVVLGDTILTNTVPMAWMYSIQGKCIHNEAGLRSMYPSVVRDIHKNMSVDEFVSRQRRDPWHLLTVEPFPEQYDTFTASAGCEYLFAPLEINRAHLIREGHDENRIFVIGGVVVDALEAKTSEKPARSIFEVYPQLKHKRWIRVDIHRKENMTRQRLSSILGAISRLTKMGHQINYVEMNAARQTMEQFGLLGDLHRLRRYRNFLYTPIWQEYAHVIEFYRSEHCAMALTDSGGLQEELNMLGTPCLTLRFNSDRPETILEGMGNILVPPLNEEFIVRTVQHVLKSAGLSEQMRKPKRLYGKRVGALFIEKVSRIMKENAEAWSWASQRLGLDKGRRRKARPASSPEA